MKKTITVLVGIPCAGKSSYTKKFKDEYGWPGHVAIIGRDLIRDMYFPKPYMHRAKDEVQVGKIFYDDFKALLLDDSISHIIVDNTHCKEKYIDVYIDKLIKKTYKDFTVELQIIFFDIPLWLSLIRNVLRFAVTGRWIPINIIMNMNKNYKKLNREKYAAYMVHK